MPTEEATLRTTIGKNIARCRKAHGDTQAALGQKLNYSDKAVSKWERGESIPDVYVLSKIAELYGFTVGNLIGETKPEIEKSPYLHLFILLGSWALTFVFASLLVVVFEMTDVPFNTWMFLLYGAVLSAVLAVVFTSLWWNLWCQLAAWSSLIWLTGIAIVLTLAQVGIVNTRTYLVCIALQALVLCWIFYCMTKRPGRRRRKKKEEVS